jgi:hypothetical protein
VYVRIKRISGRRYVYLVEGVRDGKSVTQKVVAYLGPFALLFTGIPEQVRRKVQSKTKRKIDWSRITGQINKIPIELEELDEVRKRGFATAIKAKSLVKPFPLKRVATIDELLNQRVRGELAALSKIGSRRFAEMFEKLDERTYRLRS